MPLVVRLGEPSPAIPGGRVAFVVQVHNDEPRPLNVTVEVVGAAARWAQVQPARLHLDAGGSDSARLWFDVPPTEADGPGFLPFSVRVDALQDPALTAFAQAALHLTPFRSLTAVLDPPVVAGLEGARLSVAITNHKTTPVDVSVTLAETRDDRPRLRATIEPGRLTIGPGATAGSTVRIEAPARPRLFERHHPLAVDVTGSDGTAALAPGEFVQKPVVPRWTLATPVLLVALVTAAVVLRPSGTPSSRRVPRETPTDQVIEAPADPGLAPSGIGEPLVSPPTTGAPPGGPGIANPPSSPPGSDRPVLAVLRGQVVQQQPSGWAALSPPPDEAGGDARAPTWTPDGRVLYTLARASGSEVRLDPSSTASGALLIDGAVAASVSPDGHWIAYYACPGAPCGSPSFVIRAFGPSGPTGNEVVQPLTALPTVVPAPAWVPAGDFQRAVFGMGGALAYLDVTRAAAGPGAVLHVPVDVGGRTPESPSFLDPDTVIFADAATHELLRSSLSGGGAVALGPTGTSATLGRSRSDVVYLDPDQNVCRMTPTGAARPCLTTGGGYADPSW